MEIPKRKRILEQTRKEFLIRGYSGFTMDDISAKTGISKATIYKYFPGKHDLIKGLVQEIIDEDCLQQERMLAMDKSFVVLIKEMLSVAEEKLAFFQNHILLDLEKYAPDILEMIHKARERDMPGFVSVLVQRGQKEKKIREEMRPELVAYALMVLIREFAKHKVLQQFQTDSKEVHDFLINLTFSGILTKSGEKELSRVLERKG